MLQNSRKVIIDDSLFTTHDYSNGYVADILKPISTWENTLPNSHSVK